MIQKPYTVAELPESLLNPDGNIWASDVYSIARSKKRKRAELAVAVDGEVINLYDIRSSKLITSYVVSPNALFTCPPCSVWFPRQGDEPAQRRTYCSNTASKPKLQLFSESFSLRAGQSRNLSTAAIELTGSTGSVVHLEVIGNEGSDLSNGKVLVVHADGEVRCFSENLQVQDWKVKTSGQVEFALTMNVEQAQHTILKNREDILAMLGNFDDASKIQLLVLVTHSSNNSKNVSALWIAQIRTAQFDQSPLRELASLTLPQPPSLNVGKLKYSWHVGSGWLLQYHNSALATYDLTRAVPQLTYQMDFSKEKVNDCLILSPHSVAINSKTSISITDLQYRSLQESHPFDRSFVGKHRHETTIRLVSHIAALDLIVALQGRKIVSVQLSTSNRNGPWKRKKDGLLINSIGLGGFSKNKELKRTLENAPKALGALLDLSESSKHWNKRKHTLNDLFVKGNLEDFERIIEAEIGLTDIKEEHDGSALPDLRKLHYIFNKMFSVASGSPTNLKISWFPRELSRWLIRKGLFTVNQIETSLKVYGTLPRASHLSTSEFVQAITQWDQSLELLLFVLQSPVPLDTSGTIQALQQLIILGDRKDENLIDHDEIKADDDKPPADSPALLTTSNEKGIAHRLFECIVARLSTHETSQISRVLKTKLSILEIRRLIDLLRTELAQGKWLSPHIDEDPPPFSNATPLSSTPLYHLTKLFNCAIDSLGTAGWITNSPLANPADTIAYIKVEISLALEGIEEAVYLTGMLDKILLHHSKTSSSSHPLHISLPQPPHASGVPPNSLPLGLDPALAQGITAKRVGSGGQLLHRSHREMAVIKSGLVGEYSFERINI